MRIDLSVQPGSWIEARTATLAGYNQELVEAAAARGIAPTQLQDADDPARLGLIVPHQLALMHWQVKAWAVTNADGDPLPAPRDVTADDLALCDERVLAAILQAVDQARAGEPAAIPDPNGRPPSSDS